MQCILNLIKIVLISNFYSLIKLEDSLGFRVWHQIVKRNNLEDVGR